VIITKLNFTLFLLKKILLSFNLPLACAAAAVLFYSICAKAKNKIRKVLPPLACNSLPPSLRKRPLLCRLLLPLSPKERRLRREKQMEICPFVPPAILQISFLFLFIRIKIRMRREKQMEIWRIPALAVEEQQMHFSYLLE
jgi:hypothetical protein